MHDKELTEKEVKYPTNFNYKTCQLYGLPKVHKSIKINEIIQKTKSEYISVFRPTDISFHFIFHFIIFIHVKSFSYKYCFSN